MRLGLPQILRCSRRGETSYLQRESCCPAGLSSDGGNSAQPHNVGPPQHLSVLRLVYVSVHMFYLCVMCLSFRSVVSLSSKARTFAAVAANLLILFLNC